MKLTHYDEDMRSEDFVFEAKVKKINQLKEKKRTKAIHLDKLPLQNDQEVK